MRERTGVVLAVAREGVGRLAPLPDRGRRPPRACVHAVRAQRQHSGAEQHGRHRCHGRHRDVCVTAATIFHVRVAGSRRAWRRVEIQMDLRVGIPGRDERTRAQPHIFWRRNFATASPDGLRQQASCAPSSVVPANETDSSVGTDSAVGRTGRASARKKTFNVACSWIGFSRRGARPIEVWSSCSHRHSEHVSPVPHPRRATNVFG